MSHCKRQSRAESFLQIENRRKERQSELAVNKSSKATWFLSPFIRQVNIDIFLLHSDFSSWKLLVICLNFEESSATNKAHSSVAGIFQRLNKVRKSACSFVTSPMIGYKDKTTFSDWASFKGEIWRETMFWKWNGSREFLNSWKECGSVVSSRFFWGEYCVTSQKRL